MELIKFETDKLHDARNKEREKYDRDTAYRFEKLEELSKKDPMDVIAEITGQQSGFEQLLISGLSDDCLVLVMKILALACSADTVEDKGIITTLAFKEILHKSLQSFVLNLTVQDEAERKRSYFWKDPKSFFSNSAMVFQVLIDSVPSRAYEVLVKTVKSFKVTITSLSDEGVDEEALSMFEKLGVLLDIIESEMTNQVKEAKAKRKHENDCNFEPPNDFRHLDVYPSVDDVLQRRGYLRKNLIDKGYKNVDHYLDVQFRLLKEDFVGPLRDGIAEYLRYTGPHKGVLKASDVRIYTKVRFISKTLINGQLGVLLELQAIGGKAIKIDSSKRFMFGSLLCFTHNNFQSVFYGKVLERNAKLLEMGQVIVGFEPEQNNYVLDRPYVMVECLVYFEPYYHVLKALQNIDETQFPMQKYIIDLDSTIDSISYIKPELSYMVGNTITLNPTQRNAFNTALEKEFVVIQGPPGTGKTFLGLEIAKTLIKNKDHWYNSSPILVVCYTNHALDQFLEGLRNTTSAMVRVGGQSKNQNMAEFLLNQRRRFFKKSARDDIAFNALEQNSNECLMRIRHYGDILKDIANNNVIINIKKFSVIDENISSSWFWTTTNEDIIKWLFGKTNDAQRRLEIFKMKLKKNAFKQENTNESLRNDFGEVLYKKFKEEREIEIDIDIDFKKSTNLYLLTVHEIKFSIQKIQYEEIMKEVEDDVDKNKQLELRQLRRERFRLQYQLDHLQARFKEYEDVKVTNKPQYYNLQKPHSMLSHERWQLYFYWLEKYKEHLKKILVGLEDNFMTINAEYNKMKDRIDLKIMKKMLVVGMTTTGAARLHTIIKNLQSPIVIVEKAAEVLESHVIVSLTSHCQHLILIGDHQQLRPSTSNYYIERHYNFGVSLFERMVRNNLQCHVLGVQHRMRPEIASLIVPAIYPKLENHPSVYDFPPVSGIVPNLYFIDHKFEEQESTDSSKFNLHEAKFLIALARYLIQNGYEPEDITILAAYSGQMFTLWNEQRNCLKLLEGVRIAVLDNYQGEESKIILLSLVRNNKEGKIGFLKNENRVCVALSRAKEGFYMMGNMDLLCQSSNIWPKIKTVLESQGNLGGSLLLRCQIHLDHETSVALAEDFKQVAEGGCNIDCNTQLTCGHYCTKLCHFLDKTHTNFKCQAKCVEILCENNHVCPDICFKKCKPCSVPMMRALRCGHNHRLPCHVNIGTVSCPTPVEAKLPCGHTDPRKPCYQSINKHKCPFPCDTRVEPCGHTCLKMCHIKHDPDHLRYECRKPCNKPRLDCSTGTHTCRNKCYEKCAPCEVVVEKKRSCTHKVKVPCNVDPNKIQCNNNCKRSLLCGHACKKKCNEPCGDCKVMVTKEVEVCKHPVRTTCGGTPSRRFCYKKCPLLLPCGHKCQNRCNMPCTTSCKTLVDHPNRAACGHSFKIECSMRHTSLPSDSFDLLKLCDVPCQAILSCTHRCSGTCGECAQGRFHKACKEKCGATLVCGHPCPINCRDACQPCARKCSYRCRHKACRKMCGEPCTKCTKECTRNCRHIKCTAMCSDVCTVPPCERRCSKKLSCGHYCVGFCGDPCPPLCRKCNYQELTDIFFGEEDEKDAVFVVLDECKHVFESKGMDKWLQGTEEDQAKIAPKCCPRCKTILTSTQRYSDYIKKAMLNVSKVKDKYCYNHVDTIKKRVAFLNKMAVLKREQKLMEGSIFNATLKKFKTPITFTKKKMLYTVYLGKLEIIENIVAVLKKANLKTIKLTENVNFLLTALMRNQKSLSKQETSDFEKEMKRFYLLVQLTQIRDSDQFPQLKTNTEFQDVFIKTCDVLFFATIFTDALEAEVIKNLNCIMEVYKVEVSRFEFKQVVNAMGMAKGHWFKCPNGHIYAIGECGGAMQTSKCADCGADIGGRNHQLESRNSHAGDVDESRFAAYSEEANNLFNYQEFRNF